MVARGHSNREIAARLGISEDGVKAHVRRLLDKYAVPNRTALVQAVAGREPPPELSVPEVLDVTMETLAEIIGTTAARNMVRRAVKHAAERDPDFPLSSAFVIGAWPDQWSEVRGDEALRALGAITRELWPLLMASSGEVLVQRLEGRGMSRDGLTDQEDMETWVRGR